MGAMTGTGGAVWTYDPGRAGVFSFDGPVASGVQMNAPHSGDASVTVSGLNFGSSVYTATTAIGSAPCSTSMWTSGTSVACQMGIALAEAQTSELTVGGVVGTGYHIFTFDAPVASFVQLNVAHSVMGSVTVTGLQFGLGEYTASGGLRDSIVSLLAK